MSRSHRLLPVCIAISILSWASAYPFVRIGLHDFAPVPLAALRYAIAGGLALIWLLWKRPPMLRLRDVPQVLACGVIGIALYNVCFNMGEQTVSSGAASLIICSTPLMAGLIATVFFGERLSLWGWTGSAVSFLGVVLIAGGQSGGISFGSGATLVFAAAVCGALYTNLQKKLVRHYGALTTIAYVIMTGAVFLSPWLMQGVETFAHAGVSARVAVVELAVFPAVVGYAAWGFVIGQLGAARGAVLFYLLPPVTIMMAYALSGEVPAVRTLLGGAVVMAGVAVTNIWGRRKVEVPRQVEA